MEDSVVTPRRRKPWALSIFGLAAAGSLIAMPFLAGEPEAEKMPDMVRFLGHFHPVFLHLPIGIFALIILQELSSMFGRRYREDVASHSLFSMVCGAGSAVIAVILGFLLYHGGEEYAGSALAERHLWGGLVFAVVAILTLILKAWTVATGANPAFYRLLLFVSVGTMGFTSHDGASLTHGEDYLTEYAPAPIRAAMGLEVKSPKTITNSAGKSDGAQMDPVDPDNLLVYTDVIAPILEKRCVQCHKESKAKGKFRMDTYELLVKGGKEGPGLEPGDSEKSNIVIRMDLPEDDEEHMPPEGKTPLEAAEIALIKWWIDEGADPEKTAKELQMPATFADLATKEKSSPESASAKANSAVPKKLSDEMNLAFAALSKEFPGALNLEAQGSTLLTFTAVSLRGTLDDAAFKRFATVVPNLVTVDLSATKITDSSVAGLIGAKDLRLIRLAETSITDSAIDTLIQLPALESINLYGTKITDAGLVKLGGMKNLKRLYLWKTAVTPAAIEALKQKLPDCEIVAGVEA